MSGMKVTYNGYTFTDTGHTWLERKAKYESDLPQNPAFRSLTTYTVKQTFLEPSFADNQARYAAMRAALAATRAALTILDENGKALFSGLATVQTDDLPAQWGQTLLEVSVAFLVVENISAAASGNDATFTTQDGGTIPLPTVTSFKEGVKADRYSPLVPNRRETQGTVTLAGKIHVDPAATTAQAKLFLMEQKEAIESCIDSAEGTLVFNEFSRLVKIEAATADLQDGTMILDWTITASYLRFPGANYLETQYTLEEKDDLGKKERLIAVKGTIRAFDEASARSQADEMAAGFATDGALLQRKDVSVQRLNGADSGGGDTFVELTFAFDLRQALTGPASFTLTSTDRLDVRSGVIRTTLAGKARASTSAAALTQARACGAAKYPVLVESTEAIETQDLEGEDYFVEVTFSYEYLRRGTWQYAEVTSVMEVQTVGNGTQTISGVAMAASAGDALLLARSFQLPSSSFVQTSRETQSDIHQTDFSQAPGDGTEGGDAAVQHVKVEFSYGYFLPGPTSASVQFSTRTTEDFNTRDLTTEVSGTCYASATATADTLIASMWSNLLSVTGTRKVKIEKTVQNQQAGTAQIYTGTGFTLTVVAPLDANGDDLLEAAVSVETIYSGDKTVITPIPYGTPFVQTDLGGTPGSKTASGSVTALTQATALAWARTKIVPGGYPDPARETLHTTYYPLSGTLVRAFKVDFTYRTAFDSLPFPGAS